MEKSNSTLAIKWDIDHAISRTEKLLGLLEQAKEKAETKSTLPGMTIGEALKQSPKKSASRFDENGCLITVTSYENKAGKHLFTMVNDQRPELTELDFAWSPTVEDLEATDWFPVKEMTTRERAEMLNQVAASSTSILIGDLAKILKQNGVEIGQKRLFSWLRDKGFLIKRKGADWNSPTQRAMEAGLFEIKETAFSHSDGHVTVTKTTKVTGKGQQYFINKFLEAAG
ncbi:phage antirepressor KilAC domain-containing protein [Faecalibaculum rodentium]|uniref:phage antirepressor KilAC domain-containing protein n=2 Tax=Faecalibaculum rodentium TaxID=1702221 RepID=UPI0025B759ED|nr:phage antirepressor KilAC domain-containing protein [Faecalibaculum rodentium]